MREMKNSGFEWIGTIPCHWNLTRIANLYRVRNQKVSDKDFPPLSVTMKGIVPQLETAAKTNDGDNRKLVRIGDFAINSRSDRRGSCGISALDGSVSLINTVLMPLSEMNPRYYNWLFHTVQFADEYYKCGHGIVDDLWTTTWQEMKKIVIPTPPLDEQKKIAEFLDVKCSEIDALIADIQAQIETLEQYKRSTVAEAVTKGINPNVSMKYSGAGWLGDIPAHWRVDKFKYRLTRNEPRNPGDKIVLSLYRELGIIQKDSRDDNHNQTSEDTSKYKYVKPGNFVVNKMKAWQGSVAVSNYEGIVSPAYYIYKFLDDSFDKRYFHYLLRGCYKDEFMRLSGGMRVGQWDLYAEDLENTTIIIPRIEEQIAISKYLDEKCTEVDTCAKTKKSQITTLEAYKKSIIFEYVTGKKEVV